MNWTLRNDRPVYAQLAEKVIQLILDGTYPPESRLPSVRDFALMASVNPNTMQKALSQLEEEGLITTARTAGRFVTEDPDLIARHRALLGKEETDRFLSRMKDLGFTPREIHTIIEQQLKEEPHE